MRVDASAPGKLVLLGEYAVLEGAPALVLAVDRRARVTLTPNANGVWEIISPTLGLEAHLQLGTDRAEWKGHAPPELAWVATLLVQFPFTRTLAPCRVELDSDRFYLEHAGARVKLGLGSSAALTVALLGALHALAGKPAPSLSECVTAHRTIQYGRGSGIDIAASLHGGLSRYQLNPARQPSHTPLAWPDGLHWRCAYSGHPASTRDMLAAIAAWREREPGYYARRMRDLGTISSRGVDAVARQDTSASLTSFHDYALALDLLGKASSVDIFSQPHRELAALADECGCVYKSCGAGGGDVGITFSVDDMRLREFAAHAAQAEFRLIEMEMDSGGMQTKATV